MLGYEMEFLTFGGGCGPKGVLGYTGYREGNRKINLRIRTGYVPAS